MTASISIARNKNYYLNLAAQDYYHREKSGVWAGSGAEKLGLTGEIDKDSMGHIWTGYGPDGSTALTQNAGKSGRRAAWDVTFSPDKTVSAIWAVSDKEMQAQIEAAHHQSVLDSINYLEHEAAYTRRGHGGTRQEKVGLVVGTFQHGASRAGDPQLHTHALVMNVGARDDDSYGSINSHHLYTSKMASGAVYRARLATELENLGFDIERRDDGSFRVAGVPQELTDHWSSRSHQLKEHLEEQGLEETAKNKEKANLATRSKKEEVHEEKLKAEWKETGKKYGLTAEVVRSLIKERKELSEFEQKQNQKKALQEALEKCTHHQSMFTEKELDRALADSPLGSG